MLFAAKSAEKVQAQITAFANTWEWGLEAAQEHAAVLHSVHDRVPRAIARKHEFL